MCRTPPINLEAPPSILINQLTREQLISEICSTYTKRYQHTIFLGTSPPHATTAHSLHVNLKPDAVRVSKSNASASMWYPRRAGLRLPKCCTPQGHVSTYPEHSNRLMVSNPRTRVYRATNRRRSERTTCRYCDVLKLWAFLLLQTIVLTQYCLHVRRHLTESPTARGIYSRAEGKLETDFLRAWTNNDICCWCLRKNIHRSRAHCRGWNWVGVLRQRFFLVVSPMFSYICDCMNNRVRWLRCTLFLSGMCTHGSTRRSHLTIGIAFLRSQDRPSRVFAKPGLCLYG